ncbi:MAG: hypothetical protein JW723_05355 [Bacteroidales bacterium]|nr:hypothetical protein [Bacteroidales bacterium]
MSVSGITFAGDGISLYTPYVKISVPPGESVDYSIDIKNNGSETRNVDIFISGLPGDWEYTLKAGGFNIKQVSVLPGEKRTLSLKIDIPLNINKGNYQFKVIARNYDALPLVINVSAQGSFKTEFTSEQINMQGHAKSNFSFTTRLKNQTGEKQVYSLQASPPKGWTVIFKPNYKQATAVEIEPNNTANVTIDISPPFNTEAGNYKIPVHASNRSSSASLDLEVVITGTFDMELTTPSGLLSYDITAGNTKRIELAVVNTGSSELKNIVFRSSNPVNWEITFKPDTLPQLKAGETSQVIASIKAYEKAIPGDYVTTITAQTNEVSSKASLRISVKTPLLWGWIGIFIIVATLGIIFYLYRKYGRR